MLGIKTQFGQKDLDIVANVESLLLNSANGLAPTIPEDITTLYKADVEIERLGLQLRMLPDVIQQYKATFNCWYTNKKGNIYPHNWWCS